MGFFGNISPEWLEAQYSLWRESPERVPADLRSFFAGFDLGEEVTASPHAAVEASLKESGVQSLIYRYRDVGHLMACTDPLSPCKTDHPFFHLSNFSLYEGDLDRTFHTRRFMKTNATLREILAVMRDTYCRSIGVEFMHIQQPEERQWLIERMEPVRNRPQLSVQERLAIYGQLLEATLFESFLHGKFVGQTRFSLEGGETLVVVLEALVERAAPNGVTDLIMGMPHRGRLTVLAQVLGMPLEDIFAAFRDNAEYRVVGDGDVKYHIGFSADRDFGDGRIHMTLAANPSHLEAIDPVVEGKTRARQDRCGENAGKRVIPLLIHGDAAFAGQGVVAETLNLSQLKGFGTGGTIHIVLNNQIGFTTRPVDARSSFYSTDAAKMVMAPIFHVHGEDPEAAVQAARLAFDYRQTFACDVVIEIICYRRYGHNEGDEPYFTQPLMYERIKERPRVAELYAEKLRDRGIDPPVKELSEKINARLEKAMAAEPGKPDAGFRGDWSRVRREYSTEKVATGVKPQVIIELAEKATRLPDGVTMHEKVAALLERRREAVLKGEGIDWGNAEMLAFASLLHEGTSIRLTGQDVGRGTFSQRHGIIYDIRTDRSFRLLDSAAANGACFHLYDSMLSEVAVLGFEYGYSLESPETLTMWEAQYGDFANGAQVVIDQFITSGETKWNRMSGLVMLLPHGYEGQGAEHSSARIERFLEGCASDNMLVANPTTPAQYFHLLRRQVKQQFRKPLVVFTPKSLLRHPMCVSRADELAGDSFHEILVTAEKPEKTRAVLICSGKIFYELLERRNRDGREDAALVRIEQLYPLRLDLLKEVLSRFRDSRVKWVQEEPVNMGAWRWIRPQLAKILGREPQYAGRPEDSAPAVGSYRVHKEEQERVPAEAFK